MTFLSEDPLHEYISPPKKCALNKIAVAQFKGKTTYNYFLGNKAG